MEETKTWRVCSTPHEYCRFHLFPTVRSHTHSMEKLHLPLLEYPTVKDRFVPSARHYPAPTTNHTHRHVIHYIPMIPYNPRYPVSATVQYAKSGSPPQYKVLLSFMTIFCACCTAVVTAHPDRGIQSARFGEGEEKPPCRSRSLEFGVLPLHVVSSFLLGGNRDEGRLAAASDVLFRTFSVHPDLSRHARLP